MKFVVDFVGEIEASNWKDAQSKVFKVMEKLDEIFEQFDLSLEESEDDECFEHILEMMENE